MREGRHPRRRTRASYRNCNGWRAVGTGTVVLYSYAGLDSTNPGMMRLTMSASLSELGRLVQALREQKSVSQEQLAKTLGAPTNRSALAHLEQGLRLPQPAVLEAICTYLAVPASYWRHLSDPGVQRRVSFEEGLSELVGRSVTLTGHDNSTDRAASEQIARVFGASATEAQARDLLNSILTFYGVAPVSAGFFHRYLGADCIKSPEHFLGAVRRYQSEAIRLFSTFASAYEALNGARELEHFLSPLARRDDEIFRQRTDWSEIRVLPDDRLPDLGYISAARVRQELNERQAVSTFLRELAQSLRKEGKTAVDQISEKKRKKMDSLMRRFGTALVHQLMSPLFVPDADQLEREAIAIAPSENTDLARMEETQTIAQQNLAKYLAADHLDIYVATSMRNDADFVSVNAFVQQLFGHHDVRPLKLRYFNPTQSWIEDRVAKGLVEALMLRRASITIYMAQKEDTFGKDSEASVALGQGKPVFVFVAKLPVGEVNVDSE